MWANFVLLISLYYRLLHHAKCLLSPFYPSYYLSYSNQVLYGTLVTIAFTILRRLAGGKKPYNYMEFSARKYEYSLYIICAYPAVYQLLTLESTGGLLQFLGPKYGIHVFLLGCYYPVVYFCTGVAVECFRAMKQATGYAEDFWKKDQLILTAMLLITAWKPNLGCFKEFYISGFLLFMSWGILRCFARADKPQKSKNRNLK